MMQTPLWRDQALCAILPGLPWLQEPERISGTARRSMMVVCASCPVFSDCLAEVHETGITGGFWAGRFRHHPHELDLVRGAA